MINTDERRVIHEITPLMGKDILYVADRHKKEFTYHSNKVQVAQYTISGKFIRHYNNITEAEQELQINTIKQAISKKCLAGGFQ